MRPGPYPTQAGGNPGFPGGRPDAGEGPFGVRHPGGPSQPGAPDRLGKAGAGRRAAAFARGPGRWSVMGCRYQAADQF